jgi:cytoskeletal protein RodZ
MNTSTQDKDQLDLHELKKIREKQRFTEQAVADGMKVSINFVHYIESGEFEKLGAPTFVRGHVTNYCKVLGIEPNKVLAQIPSQVLQHQNLQTSDALGSSPLSHVRRQSSYLGRYAFGTALLGMLCMSFYFVWDKWSITNDTQMNQDLVSSQVSIESTGEKKMTYSSLIPQVSGPNFEVIQPNEVSSNQVDENGEPLFTDETSTEDQSNGVSTNVETESDEISSDSQTPVITVDSSSQGGATTAYSIVMKFEEQAWVSIKTLDGDHIVQDLLGPGTREFQVTEPVHFRIGNAQKMQLSINNNTVELAPVIKKDIADFKWPFEPNS